MNNKFVIVGILIIGALYFLYPKYQEKQFENKIRERSKNLKVDEGIRQAIANLPIEGSMLNQYPELLVYIRMIDFTGSEIPAQAREMIKNIPCRNLQMFKGKGEIVIKANANVFEEDRVAWTYTVQNKYGKELLKHRQVVAECPNFNEFKNYKTPDYVMNEAPDSKPVSQKTMDENARLENGG